MSAAHIQDPSTYAENLDQAAARWQVSRDFLRDKIAEGKLPAFRASRKVLRVRIADVDALFAPMNEAARAITHGGGHVA